MSTTIRPPVSPGPAPTPPRPDPAAERLRAERIRADIHRGRARRGARRRLLSDVLVWALWASAALAVALYLAYGGAAEWTSLAGVLTGIGIIAGLVGTDFVLVMLVLAARIPALDRAIGHDRALHVHKLLGKPALYLILAHGVFLTFGYGIAEGLNPVAETVSLFGIADMPLAYLGFGLFLTVVLTSLVAVRRKLPYEVWHVIHLLSYAAVLTSLPHQLSVGGVLAEGTWQRIYWITFSVVALGAIVLFRFAEPVIQTLRHRIRVERVEWITDDVVSLHLTGQRLDELGARGGQFFFWRFWTGRTFWHAHPLSLSAAPTHTRARITVRILGKGSARLTRLEPGTPVSFSGPFGLFTDASREAPKLAILAAGIGITPARALLEDGARERGEATIVVRASTESELYLWDEMRALAQRDGDKLYRLVGPRGGADDWMPGRDRARGVTLRSIFPELDDSDLYICGPTAWNAAVADEARRVGVPESRIHTERFDW